MDQYTVTQAMSEEFKRQVLIEKAYLMFVNGREHNVFVDDIGVFYVGGKIALHKIVMLVDRPGRGGASIRIVSPNEESHAIAPGEELLHSEPCVVPSTNLNLQIKMDKIDLVEDQWRPVLTARTFDMDGLVIPSVLCDIIPSFRKYLSKTRDSFSSVDQSVTIHMPPPKPISREEQCKLTLPKKLTPTLSICEDDMYEDNSEESSGN